MDGVASQEGRLLFMTTNHIERLDPALSRPGRIDVRVELGYAKKDQLERLFLNFYPEQKKLAVSFAESIPESVQLTTALVQSHFMNFKNDAQAAVSNAALLKESRSYE
jgi:chaperone BCS1